MSGEVLFAKTLRAAIILKSGLISTRNIAERFFYVYYGSINTEGNTVLTNSEQQYAMTNECFTVTWCFPCKHMENSLRRDEFLSAIAQLFSHKLNIFYVSWRRRANVNKKWGTYYRGEQYIVTF